MIRPYHENKWIAVEPIEGKIYGTRTLVRRKIEILHYLKKTRSYVDQPDAAEDRHHWRM